LKYDNIMISEDGIECVPYQITFCHYNIYGFGLFLNY
jgi:hypothetical protein